MGRWVLVFGVIVACNGEPNDIVDAGGAPTDGPGAPDAMPEPDAAPLTGCPPPSSTLFCEDFLDGARLDPDFTATPLDTTPGFASAPAMTTTPPTGSGSDGAYAPGASESLGAGAHDFTDVTIAGGVTIDAPGDLTLRATGSVTITGGATLSVDGNLTIAAASAVDIDCGSIETTGDIYVFADTPGVTIHCATGTSSLTTADSIADRTGSVQIQTRGPVTIGPGALIKTGDRDTSSMFNSSGPVQVVSYGDVVLRGSARVETGTAGVGDATIDVVTESDIRLEDGAEMVTGAEQSSASTPSIYMHARGDLIMTGASTMTTGKNASSRFEIDGAVDLSGASVIEARAWVITSALTLSGGSRLEGGVFEVNGPFTLESGSEVYSRDSVCQSGGDVFVHVDGDISLSGDSYLRAGNATTDGFCVLQAGGWLRMDVSGSVSATGTSGSGPWLRQGIGDPPGIVDLEQGVPVEVIVDSGVWYWRETLSIALDEHEEQTIVSLDEGWGPGDVVGEIAVSVDGSDTGFVTPDALEGQTLSGQWKFRLRIPSRMFDPVTLDYFSIAVE